MNAEGKSNVHAQGGFQTAHQTGIGECGQLRAVQEHHTGKRRTGNTISKNVLSNIKFSEG